jgi:hypothetical protein
VPKHQQKNRWSAEATAHSDALDLEPKVFEKKSAGQIAESLKRSAESSDAGNRVRSGQRCRC